MLKIWFAQYKLYFILAGLALLVGGTAYAVWTYKEATAVIERQQAVATANKEAQKKIDAAEQEATFYRDLADGKFAALMTRIGNIKVNNVTNITNVRNEIAANKEFYDQPLPLKGAQLWLKVRDDYNKAASPLPSQ